MSHPQQLEVIHRLSEGSKKFLRELLSGGDTGNRLDQLFVKLSTVEHQQILLLELVEGETGPITNLQRKVNELMATQEERLQTIQNQLTSIAEGINTLQQQLADLKANNPALEDEIGNIENTVKAIADDLNPPPPPEG